MYDGHKLYKTVPEKKNANTLCSVATVHVTRVLSVDWMVQPNHG